MYMPNVECKTRKKYESILVISCIFVLGLFQTSCYWRTKLARLQHNTSMTWYQMLNLIELNRAAVSENKTQK